VDVLRSFFTLEIDSVLIESGFTVDTGVLYEIYRYFINVPDGNGGYINFELDKEFCTNISDEDIRSGTYFTTTSKGIPGQTYTLQVEYAEKVYTSTEYMCYGSVIDSISAEPIGGIVYGKQDPDISNGFLVPCLYFVEPQNETNYYMFELSTGYNKAIYNPDDPGKGWNYEYNIYPVKNSSLQYYEGGRDNWYVSVVSDRFLPPYVNKFKMSDGDQANKWFQGTDMGFWPGNDGWQVNMYSITEPVYRYFYALSRQYYDDGGAFSPSPASPPTNFSGGAQGCFIAASISQYSMSLRNR
jgi:hypothetical protein